MVLNFHRNHRRLIRDAEKGGRGYGGGGRWRLYTYRYTVTTRMTSALSWAAMRAILMFHNCEGQCHKTVSTNHSLWRERKAEADSNRGYQPNALPLGQTGSQSVRCFDDRRFKHFLQEETAQSSALINDDLSTFFKGKLSEVSPSCFFPP